MTTENEHGYLGLKTAVTISMAVFPDLHSFVLNYFWTPYNHVETVDLCLPLPCIHPYCNLIRCYSDDIAAEVTKVG